MSKKLFVLSFLSLCLLTACNDSELVSCTTDDFVDHCEGNTLVKCLVFSDQKEGTVLRHNCKNDYCMSIDDKFDCYSDNCEQVGAQLNKPECVIENLNHPAMYDYVCIQEGNLKRLRFQKVSDCEGACIEGEDKCYKANDSCKSDGVTTPDIGSLDTRIVMDIGCHDNDLYYCDGNLDYSRTVKKRHCVGDQICVQQGNTAFCADKCTEEGKETLYCSNDNRTLNNRMCTSTQYGLYYLEHPTLHVSMVEADSYICKETDFVESAEFSSCNPETDKAYCDHNAAIRCHEFNTNNETEYNWFLNHCGGSDSYYRRYGLCQVVDDKALCLATCQEKGKKIKTCGANIEFEGLDDDLNKLLAVEYECREINGNLYAYPVVVKECNSCNSELTDCGE